MRMSILIIEDDLDLAKVLESLLKKSGFACDLSQDGEQGSFLAKTNAYDLVITDYSLPKLDGLNVIKEIRQDGHKMPIIMVSVRQSLVDKIDVLDSGADDYLCKPFSPDEFMARVRALIRRPLSLKLDPFQFHDLILDVGKFKVTRANKNIRLTNKEFSLLQYLMLNAGKIIPRDTILEHVWNGDADLFSNTLETHIMRLRQKIDCHGKKLIHNVAGRGYKLDAQL